MDRSQLVHILETSHTIAVVGASPRPNRPSHWISKYLMDQGYRVIPVNPGHDRLFGVQCFPDVASIGHPVDIVNIFRRSDQVLPIVTNALTLPELRLIWMQDGIYNREAAELAAQAEIPLVMDNCIYRFHRRMV